MRRILLIGYGNTLRSEDGAGVRAAKELSLALPEASLVLRHELQLELAETIARHDDVFFIDAARTERRGLQARPVVPDTQVRNTGAHTCSPGALLALCSSLYGRVPARTTRVTIPAATVDVGEQLSAMGRQRVAECVALVLGMVGRQ
jgi:hydrogenase maturation protease